MQAGYRRLTEQTPRTLSAVDNLFADNSDTMVQLLGSMATMSHLFYLRVPALNALFPDYRGSVLDAVTSAFHDGGVWATADLYPRYVCDYGTPSHAALRRRLLRAVHVHLLPRRRPGGLDPRRQERAAARAATTPPVPRRARTWASEPTRRRGAAYTIPTPYGGPPLPIEPPH